MEAFLNKYFWWIVAAIVLLAFFYGEEEKKKHKKKRKGHGGGSAIDVQRAVVQVSYPAQKNYVSNDHPNPMGHGLWTSETDGDEIGEQMRMNAQHMEQLEGDYGYIPDNFNGEDIDYQFDESQYEGKPYNPYEEDNTEYPTPYEEVNEAINE